MQGGQSRKRQKNRPMAGQSSNEAADRPANKAADKPANKAADKPTNREQEGDSIIYEYDRGGR